MKNIDIARMVVGVRQKEVWDQLKSRHEVLKSMSKKTKTLSTEADWLTRLFYSTALFLPEMVTELSKELHKLENTLPNRTKELSGTFLSLCHALNLLMEDDESFDIGRFTMSVEGANGKLALIGESFLKLRRGGKKAQHNLQKDTVKKMLHEIIIEEMEYSRRRIDFPKTPKIFRHLRPSSPKRHSQIWIDRLDKDDKTIWFKIKGADEPFPYSKSALKTFVTEIKKEFYPK